MKQTIFETRQRANEIQKETLAIWRQSDQSDYLEGIENDPIFSLLMMAQAYRANEAEGEVERLKTEVLDEFARLLAPYEIGHAVPATAVVKTELVAGVSEQMLNADTPFMLTPEYPFIPLLETRAINVRVRSVVRMDGRRWKVTLDFASPVSDLSSFSFAVTDLNFKDLEITINKQQLPLIKPWNYSELPFSSCFSLNAMTYNRSQVYNASMLPMDLFARQNVRQFCVAKHTPNRIIPAETETLDLVFEFSGISEGFLFDKTHIALNTVMLVNAQVHEATLTARMPIARLAGYTDDNGEASASTRQFLHLLQPLDVQIFGQTELEVRRAAADRFSQGSLVKLLNTILTKYHSDFYAFQGIKDLSTDKLLYNLQELLTKLLDASREDVMRSVSGVYLLLHHKGQMHDKDFSLSVNYLTTAGAALNNTLSQSSVFVPPSGFSRTATQIIAPPVPGTDEVDENGVQTMLRYYMLTSDRIVTPADIKVFCYKELMIRYGISNNMVKSIRVNHRQTTDRHDSGYEILVDVVLTDSPFIRRNFVNQLPMAEILLQNLLAVRSTNVYPITVSIKIEE